MSKTSDEIKKMELKEEALKYLAEMEIESIELETYAEMGGPAHVTIKLRPK